MAFGQGLLAVLLALATGQAANNPYGNPYDFFASAGFPITKGDQPINKCGQPAQPRVTLVDMNGDGQKNEALFVDDGPCYAPDNSFFVLVARPAAGQPWHALFSHTGTVKAVATRTGGWFDLEFVSAGKTVPAHYAGGVYVSGNPAPAGPAAAPAASGPAAIAGAPLPTKTAQLTPAQRGALMLAAGFKKIGATWKGCDGTSDAMIDDTDVDGGAIRDLNGDGRVEVVATDHGLECYGNTGQGYAILTQDATGKWNVLDSGAGIPTFQKTRGPGGWLDIEIGGPGFCFPVQRWAGDHFEIDHYNEYMKGICAANNMRPAVKAY